MNNLCFVIQPFSDEKFVKRYYDTYKPAIEAANLNAYRVDLDPTVKIPIEEIESKIKESIICFADISINNPNVWYELGYAFALDKDVIMICDESRIDFPFDVRHKNIIKYKTDSISDYDDLKNKITEKIKAYLQSQKTTETILLNPIKETDGLQPYELSILAFMIAEQYTDEDSVNVYDIRNRMNKAGFNDTAFSIGLRLLKAKGFITTQTDNDFSGNVYNVCSLTESGLNFIFKNIQLFDLQQPQEENNNTSRHFLDDLPF